MKIKYLVNTRGLREEDGRVFYIGSIACGYDRCYCWGVFWNDVCVYRILTGMYD